MEVQSEYMRIAHTVFARSGAHSYAQSVLVDKNFCIGAQSEVYQECVVGWEEVTAAATHNSVKCTRTHCCV